MNNSGRMRTIALIGVVALGLLAACSDDSGSDNDGGPPDDGAADVAADGGTGCGPCTNGELCLKGQQTCTCRAYDHTECRNAQGEIWWMDSCGKPTELLSTCPTACAGGVCPAQVGGSCDPNTFQKQCKDGAPLVCKAGVVTALAACGAGQRCQVECPKHYGPTGWSTAPCSTLVDEQAGCALDGPACDPYAFKPRCDGDRAVSCDMDEAVEVEEDCAAKKQQCVVGDDSASCVSPGACDPATYDDTCVDATTIKTCISGKVAEKTCTELHASRPSCYSYDSGAGGSCGPTGATPCEPASFTPSCEGTAAVNCRGWIDKQPCPPNQVCKIGSSSGQPLAVCTTPGATPCDPATYQSWCKGNIAVTCVAGYTFEQDCGTGECKADPFANCYGDGT